MQKLSFLRESLKLRVIDKQGFGISESVISILLLSIITSFTMYLVSLRQQNLYKANLNNAIDDEIRRDIEKLKSELWYEHFYEPGGKGSGKYITEEKQYAQYCSDISNTFRRLPSAPDRVWYPGSNINTYKGQKRNKIFSRNNVRIERRMVTRRPFNMGNDSIFDRSLAELTYDVIMNNKKQQWTSIQLSSEAHSWCPPT